MKKIPSLIYPFLFAVYPILALAVFNIIYMDPGSVVRSLLFAIVLTGLIWVLFKIIIKDWDKAGIITVWMLVLFFSYGQVYVQFQSSLGFTVRHRVLAGVFTAVFIYGVWWILKKLVNTATLQKALIVMGCVLVSLSTLQLGAYEFSRNREAAFSSPVHIKAGENGNTNIDASTELPDIYWILLDAHTRTDILKKYFDYDNSAFIQDLEGMGFYVGKCSQSNYPSTRYSVTSLMNANYLDQLPGVTEGIPPLNKSLVNQTIRSLGYKVIAFENRSNGHFELGEDMRLSRNQLAMGRLDLLGGPNEFEFMLMKTTALRMVYDMPQLIPGLNSQILTDGEFYEHYQQTLFILNTLPKLPQATPSPKFVFVHILVPHPPFIFSPDGKYHWAEDQKSGYRSNVQFIDARIAEAVRMIIANSKTPPIIVIQGDHGAAVSFSTPHMRMSILNAYYVNDQTKRNLYATITPVNTFRIIFNSYFGTTYPLLDDKSYYAWGEGEFNSKSLVPNTCVAP